MLRWALGFVQGLYLGEYGWRSMRCCQFKPLPNFGVFGYLRYLASRHFQVWCMTLVRGEKLLVNCRLYRLCVCYGSRTQATTRYQDCEIGQLHRRLIPKNSIANK